MNKRQQLDITFHGITVTHNLKTQGGTNKKSSYSTRKPKNQIVAASDKRNDLKFTFVDDFEKFAYLPKINIAFNWNLCKTINNVPIIDFVKASENKLADMGKRTTQGYLEALARLMQQANFFKQMSLCASRCSDTERALIDCHFSSSTENIEIKNMDKIWGSKEYSTFCRLYVDENKDLSRRLKPVN